MVPARFRRPALCGLLALLFCTGPTLAEVTPSQAEARRAAYHADINSLTFRHMDELFEAAPVANGRRVWKLPTQIRPLPTGYDVDGRHLDTQEFLERTRTNALLVIRDGRIVHELYRNHAGPESRFISFSIAKSILSVLIGKAIEDGVIGSVDDPLTRYVPELAGSGYDGVSIRQALLMRSGAAFKEVYGFGKQSALEAWYDRSMVENEVRFADMARSLTSDHAPGSVFNYSTLEAGVLGWVLERATKRPLADYTAERLWKPAGMEAPATWLLDGPAGTGQAFAGGGFNARLRDYGRFGLMMLNDGRADGRRVVSSAWVRESTVPQGTEPAAPDRTQGYQYLWWTAPDSDAFMAKGIHGQFIWVDPASRTIVVKLSYWPVAWDKTLEDDTLAFFKAMAAEAP